MNAPVREQPTGLLQQLLRLLHRVPAAQRDVLVVGQREDDVGAVLARRALHVGLLRKLPLRLRRRALHARAVGLRVLAAPGLRVRREAAEGVERRGGAAHGSQRCEVVLDAPRAAALGVAPGLLERGCARSRLRCAGRRLGLHHSRTHPRALPRTVQVAVLGRRRDGGGNEQEHARQRAASHPS